MDNSKIAAPATLQSENAAFLALQVRFQCEGEFCLTGVTKHDGAATGKQRHAVTIFYCLAWVLGFGDSHGMYHGIFDIIEHR